MGERLKQTTSRYDQEVRVAKQEILARALTETHCNVTAAAGLLGIKRDTFYRYGVTRMRKSRG